MDNKLLMTEIIQDFIQCKTYKDRKGLIALAIFMWPFMIIFFVLAGALYPPAILLYLLEMPYMKIANQEESKKSFSYFLFCLAETIMTFGLYLLSVFGLFGFLDKSPFDKITGHFYKSLDIERKQKKKKKENINLAQETSNNSLEETLNIKEVLSEAYQSDFTNNEEKEDIILTCLYVQDKIPSNSFINVYKILCTCSKKQREIIRTTNYFDIKRTIIFSLVLGQFGVDRFYIGDIEIGICKLLFGWLTFGIFPLVDVFFSYQKALNKNLEKILSIIK